MDIEEAILTEFRQQVTKQVTEQVTQQNKITGIKKALAKGKYNIEEIADLFDATTDFVLKVQNGEIE